MPGELRADDKKFLNWLEESCSRIKNLESGMKESLKRGDEEAYKKLLLEKAHFLAGAAQAAKDVLQGLPAGGREYAESRLKAFSAGARAALSLKSYFYMSALLYDDEHARGAPNNLELLLDEMRSRC
jgi:hypothetical protein